MNDVLRTEQLFRDQNRDGNSRSVAWGGGSGSNQVSGNLGGGTVKLQYSADEAAWSDVDGVTFTATGVKNFTVASGYLRNTLTDSGAGADVDSWVAA